MIKSTVSIGAILAVLALPLAAYAETAGGSSLPSAAAVPSATLSAAQSAKLRQYIVKEKKPSAKIAEQVVVGAVLPANVEVYAFPADIGVKTEYRYAKVNNHAVLVAPTTHQVIQIID